MKLKHDKIADAIYIKLSNMSYAYGKDLDDLRRIDYASDNTPRGVELLCVSKGVNVESLPRKSEIAEALEASGIKAYVMQVGYSVTQQGYVQGYVFDVNVSPSITQGTEKPTAPLTKEKEVITV
jgi:hypothetical protein